MNRERILLGILLALVVLALPYYYMDRTMRARKNEVESLDATAAPIREKAVKIKEREIALAKSKSLVKTYALRFVKNDAALEIRAEMERLAARAGVKLSAFSLSTGEALADLPDLPGTVHYKTTVTISGSKSQFLTFLQGLEQSAYLIELPDLNLPLTAPPKAVATPPPVASVPATPVLPAGFGIAGFGQTAAVPPTPQPPPTPEVSLQLTLGFFGQSAK